MHYLIKAGTTDVSVVIRIIDSADGTPETGVLFNTSGIDLEYRREGAASTDITEATLAALTTAHTDGGFLHIGNGYYRLDLPDAACASGVTGVLVHGTVTGMVVIGCYIQLVAFDPFDTVRLGLTAMPNAAAEASGGLYTRGSGAGQINQQANGRIDVNVHAISEDTTAADNCELMFDGTGYAGGTAKLGVDVVSISGDTTAADNAELMFDGTGYAGGTTKLDTNLVTWRGTQPNTLTSGRVESLVGAMATDVVTATAIAADAIGASELAAGAASEIAAAVMASVAEAQGSYTVQQILSIVLAVLAGETTDGGNTLQTPNGAATRVAATVNGSNERTAMTLTPSA
jgi:hypothetical protein